jgi:hypothetical protein
MRQDRTPYMPVPGTEGPQSPSGPPSPGHAGVKSLGVLPVKASKPQGDAGYTPIGIGSPAWERGRVAKREGRSIPVAGLPRTRGSV